MFLVVRPPDTLFLPPSTVPKWRGLRGLEVLLDLIAQREARRDFGTRARDDGDFDLRGPREAQRALALAE